MGYKNITNNNSDTYVVRNITSNIFTVVIPIKSAFINSICVAVCIRKYAESDEYELIVIGIHNSKKQEINKTSLDIINNQSIIKLTYEHYEGNYTCDIELENILRAIIDKSENPDYKRVFENNKFSYRVAEVYYFLSTKVDSEGYSADIGCRYQKFSSDIKGLINIKELLNI